MSGATPLPHGTADQLRSAIQDWPHNAGPVPSDFARLMVTQIAELIPPEGFDPNQFDEAVTQLLDNTWNTAGTDITHPETGDTIFADATEYLIFSSRLPDIAKVAFGAGFAHQLHENHKKDPQKLSNRLGFTDKDFQEPEMSPPTPEDVISEAALPVAHDLWIDPNTRVQAMELILGRRVSTEEILPSSASYNQLGVIYMIEDPADALSHLIAFKALEED